MAKVHFIIQMVASMKDNGEKISSMDMECLHLKMGHSM